MDKIDDAYKIWTRGKGTSNGGYSIRCKKGLWRVYGPTKKKAEQEARHYFAQYFADGEYDEPRVSPIDKQEQETRIEP